MTHKFENLSLNFDVAFYNWLNKFCLLQGLLFMFFFFLENWLDIQKKKKKERYVAVPKVKEYGWEVILKVLL